MGWATLDAPDSNGGWKLIIEMMRNLQTYSLIYSLSNTGCIQQLWLLFSLGIVVLRAVRHAKFME